MNCCDEFADCRQGRDCPVRAERVARIGRKDYAREELPPTVWKRQVRVLAKWMLAVYMLLMLALVAFMLAIVAFRMASTIFGLLK